MKTLKPTIFNRIITEKCPRCGKGQIFSKKTKLIELPKMNDVCDACGYSYHREPGYFLGAMYVSYGLAVLQGLITFLVCYCFFPQLPTLLVCFIIVGVITLFSMQNFKLSRVIYMYIFPN
jgi:uncharacterized protein (DUF983 family)